MLTIREALRDGRPVAAHRRETRGGHAVCVFVCGAEPAHGEPDTRYIELLVCGVPAPDGREIGLPYDGFGELLLERTQDFDARELVAELKRTGSARREKLVMTRKARARAIRAALRVSP